MTSEEIKKQMMSSVGIREDADTLYARAEVAMHAGDYPAGFTLSEQAAKMGHAGAKGLLGMCYLMKLGAEQNIEMARTCFQESVLSEEVTLKGVNLAKFYLAEMILKGDAPQHDQSHAIRLLLEAAAGGIERSLVGQVFEKIAEEYRQGLGRKKDLSQALQFCERARQMGSVNAAQLISEISNDSNAEH